MMMHATRSLSLLAPPLLAVVVAASGCPSDVGVGCGTDGGTCAPVVDDRPPRFFAEPPFGVGFDCVTIGCDTEKSLVVENRGGGKLGVSLIRTTIDTSSDFTLRRKDDKPLPTPDEQVFLGPDEKLELVVRYVPGDGIIDEGAVELEHYDAAQEYVDAAPVTDEVPLTARAFGTPAATLPSEVLDFGFVPVGSSSTLELVVDNGGTDAVLRVGPAALEDEAMTAFHPPEPADWDEGYANPGGSTTVRVAFTPATADAFFGALLIQTNDPARPTIRAVLQGTAIAEPRLAILEPVGDLALPPVRVGETRTGTVIVRNIGGAPLDVNAAITSGAERGLSASPGALTAIGPLAAGAITVALSSQQGGDVSGALTLTSNDPTAPGGSVISVTGTVNAPVLQASPPAVDFGGVVQGWIAEPRTIALGNSGFGELTVTSIGFEVGSSSQMQLVDLPPLPVKLAPGEPGVVVTVVFNAQNIGPANAVLLVGSDSVSGDTARINIFGEVITCEQGCPTANGTPSCASGRCEVGTCFAGFHDADNGPGNGCECREDVVGNVVDDIPQACLGLDLGTLSDNDNGFNRSGTLHKLSDVDLYFIRMRDDTQFFDDDYGAQVQLISGPPGLQVCANFQGPGTGCGGLPTNCSSSLVRGHGQSGFFGSSDNDEDATIFVMWAPGSNPVCGNYTIQLRADADF